MRSYLRLISTSNSYFISAEVNAEKYIVSIDQCAKQSLLFIQKQVAISPLQQIQKKSITLIDMNS